MTYFSKYLDIYRYSRNGTFFFFSLQIASHFFIQAKISAILFIFMQNIDSQINEK